MGRGKLVAVRSRLPEPLLPIEAKRRVFGGRTVGST